MPALTDPLSEYSYTCDNLERIQTIYQPVDVAFWLSQQIREKMVAGNVPDTGDGWATGTDNIYNVDEAGVMLDKQYSKTVEGEGGKSL